MKKKFFVFPALWVKFLTFLDIKEKKQNQKLWNLETDISGMASKVV